MSISTNAWFHLLWEERKLQDYGDFADCVTFCNQSEYSDDQLEGDWYYIPDEPLAEGEHKGCRVIYYGTFGNDNSPGASSYTNADIYEPGDKDFDAALAEWENSPEYSD